MRGSDEGLSIGRLLSPTIALHYFKPDSTALSASHPIRIRRFTVVE